VRVDSPACLDSALGGLRTVALCMFSRWAIQEMGGSDCKRCKAVGREVIWLNTCLMEKE
jgi:hypothetical protein